MIDERAARRPEFIEGCWVCLSDHNRWSLPIRDTTLLDPDFDSLLRAVTQAEDKNEVLLTELALTIHLLTRNYRLRPSELDDLLRFDPDDDGLSVLQSDIHLIVLAALGFGDPRQARSGSEPSQPDRVHRGWTLGWLGFRRAVRSRVASRVQTPVT